MIVKQSCQCPCCGEAVSIHNREGVRSCICLSCDIGGVRSILFISRGYEPPANIETTGYCTRCQDKLFTQRTRHVCQGYQGLYLEHKCRSCHKINFMIFLESVPHEVSEQWNKEMVWNVLG